MGLIEIKNPIMTWNQPHDFFPPLLGNKITPPSQLENCHTALTRVNACITGVQPRNVQDWAKTLRQLFTDGNSILSPPNVKNNFLYCQ